MHIAKKALRRIFEVTDSLRPLGVAHAHCDIPCGIYDPHAAQVAAHTVIRMDGLIADLVKVGKADADAQNKMARYVAVKEQHAELCKHEIRVLWADYFKPEHVQANPELHGLVWDTLKLASKAKQGTSMEDAKALLGNVEKIAEIFWKTKNVQTKRVKAFYPTGEEIVYPKV